MPAPPPRPPSSFVRCARWAAALAAWLALGALGYPATETWFEQTVDHLNFRPTLPATFPQRVFINATFWRPGGPILFYTGNEQDIGFFLNNTFLPFGW